MKNNFEYWKDSKGNTFYIIYWIIYFLFFLSGFMISLKTGNPFAFVFIGICPYFVILIYRAMHSPFNSLENGIQKYDPSLHEQLFKNIPEKYNRSSKHRAVYMLFTILKIPEEGMNTNILNFRRNYHRVNKFIWFSLFLWFISIFMLFGYLYGTSKNIY